jgi:hypothetical protein
LRSILDGQVCIQQTSLFNQPLRSHSLCLRVPSHEMIIPVGVSHKIGMSCREVNLIPSGSVVPSLSRRSVAITSPRWVECAIFCCFNRLCGPLSVCDIYQNEMSDARSLRRLSSGLLEFDGAPSSSTDFLLQPATQEVPT